MDCSNFEICPSLYKLLEWITFIFWYMTNRVDFDQRAPYGALWSGSILFAKLYNLVSSTTRVKGLLLSIESVLNCDSVNGNEYLRWNVYFDKTKSYSVWYSCRVYTWPCFYHRGPNKHALMTLLFTKCLYFLSKPYQGTIWREDSNECSLDRVLWRNKDFSKSNTHIIWGPVLSC